MCRFKSALVVRTGEVLHSPLTDRHEDLIEAFNLTDDGLDNFVRVELIPKDDYFDLDKYEFKIDQDIIPGWFLEGDCQERVITSLKDAVKQMIITDSRKTVLGGGWLVNKEGRIGNLRLGRIICAHSGANLAGANLSDAYLAGADLSRANLARAYKPYGEQLDGWLANSAGFLEKK